MISSSSLSAAQQSDMGAWLSRVYENARVLQSESGAGATQVVRMVTFVLQHLQRDADLASVIADQVLQASRTAACTDWASSALLDMQAIIAGNDLSEALKQRKQATADDKTAAAKLPMDFVQDNRQALVRLLRFSAFKQFLAEAPSFTRDHAESVEHALYLYAKLHAIYPYRGTMIFPAWPTLGLRRKPLVSKPWLIAWLRRKLHSVLRRLPHGRSRSYITSQHSVFKFGLSYRICYREIPSGCLSLIPLTGVANLGGGTRAAVGC